MRTRYRVRAGGAAYRCGIARTPRPESDGASPPGDLLSCYSAAVAHYLSRIGADAELAIGTQLYLAVRVADDGSLAFVHHHTPLRGSRATHRVELARCHATDPRVAVARILTECRRVGAVLVAGDVKRIPWQAGYGVHSAPHWLVVDGVNDVGATVRVTDRFEFTGRFGTQREWSGWISTDLLAELCRPSGVNDVWAARERHAFGDIAPRTSLTGRHIWYEAVRAPESRRLTAADKLDLLHETWAHHAGLRDRADLPAPEWRCGVAAIRTLADWFEPRLADPATYAISDDVWVAARNRALFARVVGRLADETGGPGLRHLADRATVLADIWLGVPQLLAYNEQSLVRGREPRQTPVTTLRRAAEAEAELLDELGPVLLEAAPLAAEEAS